MLSTGIPNIQTLRFIFEGIKPCAKEIKLWDGKQKLQAGRTRGRRRYKMTLFEEYILTLVRIRRGYDVRHIFFLFGVSQSQVTRTFIAWVSLLARCLGQTIEWPSKVFVMGNMPKSFSSYPNTRGIIDCTEFKVQNPFRPRAQKAAWSSYKHSNTC